NANISYAKGVGFSPFSPLLGVAPISTNEWEPPATSLILSLAVIENRARLLINPSGVLLAIDVDGFGVPQSMAPVEYSKFGAFDVAGEPSPWKWWDGCEIPREESCEARDRPCFGHCSLPNGQKGCKFFYDFYPQSPGLLSQENSCIRLKFAIPPPNPKYEFSLKIGDIQAGNASIPGPTIIFRIAVE